MGLIGLALLFHLTEQKGSRLCQTSRQCGESQPASGAYARSALPASDLSPSQALSLFPAAVATVSGRALTCSFDAYYAAFDWGQGSGASPDFL